MLDPAVLKELRTIVKPGHVLTSMEDRIAYSYDATFLEGHPDVVVTPTSTEEVSRVVQLAHARGVPVVPRGMGTGLAGGSIPCQGGIVLVLTRMNRLLEIDRVNMIATAEAGLITGELQRQVEAVDLFYPPDPASIHHSTIGGNVATNAGGPRCVKYGVTRDYVQGLTVVLADGQVLCLGGKTFKRAMGSNLMGLFIGSEGTLGIITKVMVRLIARPRAFVTALVMFPRMDDVGRAIQRILRSGAIPSTIELLDQTTIHTVEEHMHLGLPVEVDALLLIEVDGKTEQTVKDAIEVVAEVCRKAGASKVEVAHQAKDRDALWAARRAVGPSVARRAPNLLGEDISLPIAAIPEAMRRLRALPERFGLPMVIYGHAGDGNLHPNILFNRRDPSHLPVVERMVGEIFAIAVALGGTLSGEHGIGLAKQTYLHKALHPVALEAMRQVKAALDPNDILNPGKIFPPEPSPQLCTHQVKPVP
jgi:glycolate oxidase